MIALSALAAAGGLVVLLKAADELVVGSARLAVAWRVSPVVVGALIIGFGTSAPEMLVSTLAAGQGRLDLAVGNIIGSNVANLSLVLGLTAIVFPPRVRSTTLRREVPISTLGVVLFAILVQGGLTRWEGALLLGALALAFALILRLAARDDPDLDAEVSGYVGGSGRVQVRREVLRSGLGLVGTVAGAQMLVVGAGGIAEAAGVPEAFIGLTLVAVGTSLPELVAGIQAARRRHSGLIVGNLLGSNLMNSLAVGAAAAFAGPGPLADAALTGKATILMVGVALTGAAFMGTRRQVGRWEGAALVILYLAAVPILFR